MQLLFWCLLFSEFCKRKLLNLCTCCWVNTLMQRWWPDLSSRITSALRDHQVCPELLRPDWIIRKRYCFKVQGWSKSIFTHSSLLSGRPLPLRAKDKHNFLISGIRAHSAKLFISEQWSLWSNLCLFIENHFIFFSYSNVSEFLLPSVALCNFFFRLKMIKRMKSQWIWFRTAGQNTGCPVRFEFQINSEQCFCLSLSYAI